MSFDPSEKQLTPRHLASRWRCLMFHSDRQKWDRFQDSGEYTVQPLRRQVQEHLYVDHSTPDLCAAGPWPVNMSSLNG